MKPNLDTGLMDLFQRRHLKLVRDTGRLYGREQHDAQQSTRAELDDDGEWFGPAFLEDMAIVAWILAFVLVCAVAGIYGTGLRRWLVGLLS